MAYITVNLLARCLLPLLLLLVKGTRGVGNCTAEQFWCQDRCGSSLNGDTCCTTPNGQNNLCGNSTSCCGSGCCPSGFTCNVADYSCLQYTLVVQSPVVTSTSSVPSSTSAAGYPATPTASITALVLGQFHCNDEANFPGHGPIVGDNVRLGSQQACMNTALTEDEMYDGQSQITYGMVISNVPYNFAISWVAGCKTTVDKVSPARPLNQTSQDTPGHGVVCTDLLYDNWANCTGNGGVGGYVDAGCLRYKFTPSTSS